MVTITRSNSSTSQKRAWGVHELNFVLHGKFHKKAPEVMYQDAQLGLARATTSKRLPLREGDLVMFCENDYQLNLRNGTLGRVLKALPVGSRGHRAVRSRSMSASTNHRSTGARTDTCVPYVGPQGEGNQFRRVIIPVQRSKLLDHSMLYTAVTRGVEQVVLVGDMNAAIAAIHGPSNAMRRHVTLPSLLAA